MPEGPTIIILREQVEQFASMKVLAASGNAKIDIARAKGKTVRAFKSWGKHFLICFDGFTFKVHFLLFGSYRINEEREMAPRLSLTFKNGVMNLYACSVRLLEGDLDGIYDWSGDVMSDAWDAKAVKAKLKNVPEMLVCDALLDQDMFAGVGNIIKNEVLFRTGIHPKSKVGALPVRKLNEMVKQAREYSFDFLKWRKKNMLKKHLLVHNKGACPQCHGKLVREYVGTHNRRTFFCNNCQKLYN